MQLKKFSIGYRTLKTAIGIAISIGLASLLQLEYYTSAGILTILCIQTTKRKSIHAIYTRVFASFLVMLLSYLFFSIGGYNVASLGLLVLIFIPFLVMFKITPGFVSSVVILLHIFDSANFTFDLLLNELLIMLVGFGVGFLVNFYMPDISKGLNKHRIAIEDAYSTIFHEIERYLRTGDTSWNGKELIIANEHVEKGKSLAYMDIENHLARKEDLYYRYFDIRQKQLEIIERVLPKITSLPASVEHSTIVADFIGELSENVHSGNTVVENRKKLRKVRDEFEEMPLPKTHEEFLAMSALYTFIEEIDQYFAVKQGFEGLDIKKGKVIQK
ncbi:aromatic acid exporter family protein [Kurthia zopfii]|uniref:aromatic acid exporter family protein n=1 Tax=Kurthia zopfii TaxID=1650 RepID=UPI000F6E3941|nr:aromatic acid exporter family protein [Kurthia zopfii]VEI07465.1 Predicted membrane protein [Kurthia zopfii]